MLMVLRLNLPASLRRTFATTNAIENMNGSLQARGDVEVDHLIPLELGGDNGLANLWVQPASPRPGFHEKDRLAHYRHKQVCAHAMTLEEAQRMIATDWLSVWRQIGHSAGDDGADSDNELPRRSKRTQPTRPAGRWNWVNGRTRARPHRRRVLPRRDPRRHRRGVGRASSARVLPERARRRRRCPLRPRIRSSPMRAAPEQPRRSMVWSATTGMRAAAHRESDVM